MLSSHCSQRLNSSIVWVSGVDVKECLADDEIRRSDASELDEEEAGGEGNTQC